MCYWRFIQIVFIDKLFYLCFLSGFWPCGTYFGLPKWFSDKESTCQCRRVKRGGFNPWVRKTFWTSKGQHTPVFLPGKFHDRAAWQAAVHGVTKSYIWLSEHTHIFNVKQSKANTKINTLKTVWDSVCVCVCVHARACMCTRVFLLSCNGGREKRETHSIRFIPSLTPS